MTFREYDGLNPPKILGRGLKYDLSSIVSHQFTQMNHKFYFTGYEREHGKEPWVYDGSNPPAILADITEGSNSSAPLYFTAFGNKLYFSAQDEIHGREIWVYDGINPPELLLDIEKGSGSSSPEQLMVSNDKLYFKAFTKAFGTELWQYDGINEPRMVSDLYRGPAGSDPNDLVVYKGQLYLSAVTKEEGRQLYRFCESCSNTVVSACDSYNFNGTSLYSSGRYYDTIPGSMGQDSIIRLDLTILKSSALVIDTAACERYVFAGSTLTESGIFYTTVPNSAGCDSLITLHLTIHPSTSSELEAVGCESYVAPGGRYVWKESGTYVDTIPNAAGCDSIITIHLTVNHLNTAVISSGSGLQAVSSGGEYQWVNCLENYLPITGAVDQSFTPLSPGTYAVIMKDQVCTDTSDCYTVIATDIRDIESKQGMTVYPNPTSGAFTIDLGKVYPEALITIIRYDGEVIRIERMLNSRIVDLNPYASPGIYTVNIIADKKEVNLKVIRQ
jgi:ELWxxDGT repeat protein